MPLRDEDRAVWIGDPDIRRFGSSGKVIYGIECGHGMVEVNWGEGKSSWCQPNSEVITCRQAANRGIEPWAKAFGPRGRKIGHV